MNRSETRALLTKHGLHPKKALGQNFLVDPAILTDIVAVAEIRPDDTVVEIGGGLGMLTRELVRSAGRLIVIEKDAALCALLEKEFGNAPHVRFIRADALYVDFDELLEPDTVATVVANLPYNISSEMVFRLVECRHRFRQFALMLQKEVGERLAAAPGSRTYGAISVLTQLYCDVEIALDVPASAFYPEPKVDSNFIRFRVLDAPRIAVEDERAFARAVKAAFAYRRKTLANSLRATYGDAAKTALEAAGIYPKRRAETLDLAEFAGLSEALARVAPTPTSR